MSQTLPGHLGIYHSRDLDGLSCGAVLRHFLPDAQLFPYDYGQPAPDMAPLPEHLKPISLFICDVSLPMEQMGAYRAQFGKLVWIDHHISEWRKYRAYTATHPGWETIYDPAKAACELTWTHFSETPLPHFLDLIASWDVYRHRNTSYWENQIAPFQYGMRSRCNRLEEYPMELFADDHNGRKIVTDLQAEGKSILRYVQKTQRRLSGQAFEARIAGIPAICINQRGLNGDAFAGCFRPGRHRLKCAFGFNGREWGFSIFTEDPDLDCSAIAGQFGGGGHAGAAGFRVRRLQEVFQNLLF
jgi:oligoribonuclease NrnB/cAMP/cGMP phosphodiesterase (DHH superfamily)